MIRLGFNTKQNLGSQNRTTTSVGLGKVRNTLGSITRKYNYCNRTSLNPLYCTFDLPVKPIPIPQPISGQYQIALGNTIFYVSTDFGITWSSRPQFESYYLKGVALSIDRKYILAGGFNTPLFYSNDGGISYSQRFGINDWFNMKMSKSGQYQTAIGPITQQGTGEVYVSNDYGATFVVKELPDVGGSETSFLAMSYNGKYQSITDNNKSIWISNDYGNNWTNIDISSIVLFGGNPVGIAMSGDGKLQTAINGSNGEIYRSINYGVNWSLLYNIQNVSSPYYIAISETGQYQLYSDYGGYIWVSRDFGANWTNDINIDGQAQTTLVTSGWYPCAVSATGQYQTICDFDGTIDGYIDGGYIYTSSDFGYNWFKRPSSNRGDWWGLYIS